MTSPLRVERISAELTWHAWHGSQRAGSIRAWIRPDNRCTVFFDAIQADAEQPLIAAVTRDLRRDLYAYADEDDTAALAQYARLGFAENRRESYLLIPVPQAVIALDGARLPAGVTTMSAASADEDRLRLLDDELRQDTPGADGWRWDPAGFRAETFCDEFDPATYLVAVAEASDAYVGIVRVWNNPAGPRLGFIAVGRQHRRHGLARALLREAFGVLHERGAAGVTAEVDVTNVASMSLLTALGGSRTGNSLEFLRPRDAPG